MRAAVEDAFIPWSAKFEGRTFWMYLDRLGLVTIGVGNLVDPPALLQGLDFVRADGQTPATGNEISAAWLRVKNEQPHKDIGGGQKFWQDLTSIRLTKTSLDRLIKRKLATNEVAIRAWFGPRWDTYPADAQLGILSMAWAAGAGVFQRFPTFTAACKAGDWLGAAAQCHLAGVGIEPRNLANVELFKAAAVAARNGTEDRLS